MVIDFHRVVSVFILSNHKREGTSNGNGFSDRNSLRIALFHRVSTMPSFPNHFAAISGTIEANESPFEAACREIQEETNLDQNPEPSHGLFVDVPHPTKPNKCFRVYPFRLLLDKDPQQAQDELRLEGTEHDYFSFRSVFELEQMEDAVPALAQAFHHATFGRYLDAVPNLVREWASDTQNGAATMARNAAWLLSSIRDDEGVEKSKTTARTMKLMRPSMVSLTNILQAIQEEKLTPAEALQSLEVEADRVVAATIEVIKSELQPKRLRKEGTLRIATFSRSSTLLAVIEQLLRQLESTVDDGGACQTVEIICSKSTPGDEGQRMAEDLKRFGAVCVEDDELERLLRTKAVDLLLVGSDCVMMDHKTVVNKAHTQQMAQAARASDGFCTTICAADRWKLWGDTFPPPLEDIFEVVSTSLLDHLVVPAQPRE